MEQEGVIERDCVNAREGLRLRGLKEEVGGEA